MNEEYKSLEEVADMLGVTYQLIYRLVRSAPTGRPSRTGTTKTATRGVSTSFRATAGRSATTASAGSLFALSKGPPNSEQRERIQSFDSLILGGWNEINEGLLAKM